MRKFKALKSEKGFSLLEVLVAIAIIGVIAAGFLAAMNNATKGAIKIDQIDTARTIAETQMEYVKKLPFSTTYTPQSISPSLYPGYAATITTQTAAQRNANIQKVTITITYHGVTAATLDDCKVH